MKKAIKYLFCYNYEGKCGQLCAGRTTFTLTENLTEEVIIECEKGVAEKFGMEKVIVMNLIKLEG